MKFFDAPTARVLPDREGPIQAIIIHSTGETDLNKALDWYCRADGLQPHYVIGLNAVIYRVTPESKIAYHCAINDEERSLYLLGFQNWSKFQWVDGKPVHLGDEFSGYRQWRETWYESKKLSSPLDLVTGIHPNTRSIGIELQQPEEPGPMIFNDVQYQALTELIDDINYRHQVPLDREHLLGHSDICPLRRCNAQGSWDPGRLFSYNHLFDLLMQCRQERFA